MPSTTLLRSGTDPVLQVDSEGRVKAKCVNCGHDGTLVLDETQQRALNALLGLPESDLWLEFVDSNGLCGLCGNYGVVFTSGLRSPAGVPCSVRKFCICPNGRAWKAQAADINRLPDWSGRSILRSGL